MKLNLFRLGKTFSERIYSPQAVAKLGLPWPGPLSLATINLFPHFCLCPEASVLGALPFIASLAYGSYLTYLRFFGKYSLTCQCPKNYSESRYCRKGPEMLSHKMLPPALSAFVTSCEMVSARRVIYHTNREDGGSGEFGVVRSCLLGNSPSNTTYLWLTRC